MDISQFNWVDYLIVGIIAFSVLISLVRGFVREAISLAIWLAATLIAMHFASAVSDSMRNQIAAENIRYIVSFIAIFVVVLVAGIFVNAFISALVSKTGMGAVDRLIGIIFGFLRGVLVVGTILVFINNGGIVNSEAMHSSQLAPEFKPLTAWLSDFMPQKVSQFGKWLVVKRDD